jgi:Zn-dependent protease
MYFGAAMLGQPGLLFGWAKPVPVNFSLLRRPKQDMLWVAAAGPGANLVMALVWGLVLQICIACTLKKSFPACAPPGASTLATTTASWPTGSSCSTSFPACFSSPTGMR